MTDLRFRHAFLALAIVLSIQTRARAVTFSDDFSTNPFPSRWCERWHHIHWGGTSNQLMTSFTAGPCNSDGGCCLVCSDTANCTSLAGNVSAIITRADYTGTTRSGGVAFRFPQALDNNLGEHVAVFPVIHPNCHTGYEAIVVPDGSGGYTLSTGRVTDTTRPECIGPGSFSTSVPVSPNITLGTTPRYRLSLDIVPGGTNILNLFSLVYDTVTNQSLAVKNFQTDVPTSWYNTAAKRFAIGAVQADPKSVNFDSFTGTVN